MNRFEILKGIEWKELSIPSSSNPFEVRIPKRSRWPGPVDTADQLIEELNREVNGLKDRHDYVIEHWIKISKPKLTGAL